MVSRVAAIVIATGLSVLQNNAVQRGAANGIAMTGMSLFRGLGLAIGGFLVSWTQKRKDTSFLPGLVLSFILVIYILQSSRDKLARETIALKASCPEEGVAKGNDVANDPPIIVYPREY
ncbi:hypothetical protein IFM89_022918, partial [Coptis chinensis]